MILNNSYHNENSSHFQAMIGVAQSGPQKKGLGTSARFSSFTIFLNWKRSMTTKQRKRKGCWIWVTKRHARADQVYFK